MAETMANGVDCGWWKREGNTSKFKVIREAPIWHHDEEQTNLVSAGPRRVLRLRLAHRQRRQDQSAPGHRFESTRRERENRKQVGQYLYCSNLELFAVSGSKSLSRATRR